MEVAAAQLPERGTDDWVFPTPRGLVVLDGATSHTPGTPPASDYVRHLGRHLAHQLDSTAPLPQVLRVSIAATAADLHLIRGKAPSSTVVLVRVGKASVEVLVLGDSCAVVGFRDGTHRTITDTRLSQLDLAEAQTYRARLAAGADFDQHHRELLGQLQQRERQHRNRSGGYWIAEADPNAADHALCKIFPRDRVSWVIAATDGASDTLAALEVSWPQIANHTSAQLHDELDRCEAWEAETDPRGRILPRSKRHDDKTLAVLRL
ncbi:protein phosphatase 2C domain-containing protein [Nocardia sp. CDC186]|uniref:Protein phosphatase 2C domain-containing protein n=1 Tax=Nocardia implantans TaxID=3108168 RepID=A0ABU6B1I9_9NOCA|nr:MULTISPECIES: protein phosphatase 2C domain-containing protein [unclassified Nocardia]MBF6195660.1 protein phosphatase 2C domain-containing protein [Nocardia beijingensis]MEA3531254.1 protein phosphatase 2C domain-containing protein [Nocardia sp. CDC192]MEB3513536.1 protein phosphatase 2C domain-containing protein [Nocardia sp. CDC186]